MFHSLIHLFIHFFLLSIPYPSFLFLPFPYFSLFFCFFLFSFLPFLSSILSFLLSYFSHYVWYLFSLLFFISIDLNLHLSLDPSSFPSSFHTPSSFSLVLSYLFSFISFILLPYLPSFILPLYPSSLYVFPLPFAPLPPLSPPHLLLTILILMLSIKKNYYAHSVSKFIVSFFFIKTKFTSLSLYCLC